jgi:hypothetical protein
VPRIGTGSSRGPSPPARFAVRKGQRPAWAGQPVPRQRQPVPLRRMLAGSAAGLADRGFHVLPYLPGVIDGRDVLSHQREWAGPRRNAPTGAFARTGPRRIPLWSGLVVSVGQRPRRGCSKLGAVRVPRAHRSRPAVRVYPSPAQSLRRSSSVWPIYPLRRMFWLPLRRG